MEISYFKFVYKFGMASNEFSSVLTKSINKVGFRPLNIITILLKDYFLNKYCVRKFSNMEIIIKTANWFHSPQRSVCNFVLCYKEDSKVLNLILLSLAVKLFHFVLNNNTFL